MSGRRHLTRRAVLRGALAFGGAVSVGLPLLDAMVNFSGTAHADGTSFPHRFVLWFWGNGTHPGAWAPTATGPEWVAEGLLRGLAPVKRHVTVVSGTRLPTRGVNNPHVEGAAGILTGGNPVIHPEFSGSSDWDYMTVPLPSVDELAADLVGPAPFRSLVLAVTDLHGVAGPGTAVRYTSHRAPYLFNAPTFDPAAVYGRLFGARPPDLSRASVLDAVLADGRALRSRLGAEDRARLEHHLDALRELEGRVRSGLPELSCTRPEAPAPTTSYRERARTMASLSAMAFACDLTRVVSMEFSSPASHSGYPDIFPDGLIHNGARTSFHEYEHSLGYTANVRRGLQYFVDLFGDFLGELAARPEGEGSLLDHALVLGTSEVAGGASHTFSDFPLLLAGGANGRVRQPGTHLRLDGALATRVPLTCLRALGSTAEAWGQAQFRTGDALSSVLAP